MRRMIALHTSSTRGASRSDARAPLAQQGLYAAFVVLVAFAGLAALVQTSQARPSSSSKGKKGGDQVLNFLRQRNVYSNLDFYYTNRGVLFYSGQGNGFEGLFWPRGSGNSYIFGSGLWFATQKSIEGKRRKLCDLGYNPNSGAGWYLEGEANQVGRPSTDGSTPAAKYISYVGWRYDKTSGKYLQGTSSVVPSPYYSWPLWDTSTTKTIDHNYYFGDYISDVTKRNAASLVTLGSKPNPKPAILSEEDIVNQYTDEDPSNNPEFRPNTGYPFGIDVSEAIYSWSFGRYRDMIFLRQKVTNSSKDSLLNCWMAPAFDPDLDASGPGAAAEDLNSYVDSNIVKTDADPTMVSQLRQPYRGDPTKLNMGVQWRNTAQPPNGKQYGWIGFSFLESPVIDSAGNIIANSDSVGLHGYGPNSLFQKNSLGLATFKDWTIANDPTTQDLRYDFLSSGEKDLSNGTPADQRLMLCTGPFTLPPGKSVETVVSITIAQVDNIDFKKNFGALLLLTDFAHQVFGEVQPVLGASGDTTGYVVNHFLSPVPPDVPNIKTTALDKAVLVTWDYASDSSHDLVSDDVGFRTIVVNGDTTLRSKATLPFVGYQLWRSSRSDHDSTIRPDGNNPDVMLGQWALYDFRTDTVFDANDHYFHLHYTRLNTTPHAIPHSYLDIGDDNHDGILTGSEGLFNGVSYYYYLIAYDEYDSTNQVGPLFTAVVPPKNFVVGIPNRPVYLVPFTGDTAADIPGNCLAGSGIVQPFRVDGPNYGGLQDVRLDIVDTGIFAKLFTNDTINVSFQPRWTEFVNFDLSPLEMYVDVTDTHASDTTLRIQNTYAKMQNPANNTIGYYFPILPEGTIVAHVDGTLQPDSVFASQFTTDNSAFSPNQSIDNAFKVLADVNFEQLSTPYRLDSVSVSGSGDPNILRLSRRTNNGAALDSNQNIFNLPGDSAVRPQIALGPKQVIVPGSDTAAVIGQTVTRTQLGTSNDTIYTIDKFVKWNIDSLSNPGLYDTVSAFYTSTATFYQYRTNSTRPSYLGALGETAYEVTFDSTINPGPVSVTMSDGTTLHPAALHVKVSLRDCPQAVLRSVQDTVTDMTEELNPQFYSDVTIQNGTHFAVFDDPDTFWVPNPGWYQMTAWHYEDNNPPGTIHTTAGLDQQASGKGTVGPYYFPINGPGNSESGGTYHYAVHRLSVGGAELLFNAPEILDPQGNTTGDTIAGTGKHVNPHTNDFQVGDKITLSFTGVMKNLPFPGTQFHIYTESGPKVDYAKASNYTDSMLQQVQVVPNPYIVTHLGQTSTDNAKLFFTRLPPRCTIEIYALDGTLVTTLEHNGYADTGQTVTNFDYNHLADQSSVATWNLLTSGLQRVGSQVLFARVVAKDPVSGAETGEITTKFAVVVGLSK